MYIDHQSHVAGTSMGDIDGLSRDYVLSSLDPSLRIPMDCYPELTALFSLCDPSIPCSVSDHHVAFLRVHTLLSSFLSACAPVAAQ